MTSGLQRSDTDDRHAVLREAETSLRAAARPGHPAKLMKHGGTPELWHWIVTSLADDGWEVGMDTATGEVLLTPPELAHTVYDAVKN